MLTLKTFVTEVCVNWFRRSPSIAVALIKLNNSCARNKNEKLSYRRGTARCVVSIEILPIAMQQCRNYLYNKS